MMHRTVPSTVLGALALVLLLGVALAAGCTSSPSGPATTAPTASGTTATGTVATAGTSGSAAGAGAVAVVSYDRIIPFVPKTAGAWKLDGEPTGMTMKDAEGHDYTWVTADYVKDGSDDAGAAIVIQDSAVANTPFKQQWGTFRSYESTEGWWKQVTVKGQPGWKFHDKAADDYGQWLLAGDRYFVYFNVEGASESDLDALVNAMDLQGLAAVR